MVRVRELSETLQEALYGNHSIANAQATQPKKERHVRVPAPHIFRPQQHM